MVAFIRVFCPVAKFTRRFVCHAAFVAPPGGKVSKVVALPGGNHSYQDGVYGEIHWIEMPTKECFVADILTDRYQFTKKTLPQM